MKALILAGGRGKRLNEVSATRNKCMLDLNDRPLIEHSLTNAIAAGVGEIIILVGYKAEDIINAYGISYEGKRIRYVIQGEQRGLVHAIECSEGALDGDDFFLLLGDEVLANSRHAEMVSSFLQDEGVFGICGVVRQPNREEIRKTYSVVEDGEHRIFRLVEKPRRPLNDLMGTGNCVFRNALLSYIARTPINQERAERELPDLIQCAIDEGEVVRSFVICEKYVNINSEVELQQAGTLLSEGFDGDCRAR